ncbi:MAG: STAS domain-containing protein [Spirochaetota bacterium]
MGIRAETKIPGVVLLHVDGDLDLYNAKEFSLVAESIMNSGDLRVLADLSALRFIDSSGFSVLLSLNRRLRSAGGSLIVFGLDDNTRILFRRVIAERILPVYEDEETAMRYLR